MTKLSACHIEIVVFVDEPGVPGKKPCVAGTGINSLLIQVTTGRLNYDSNIAFANRFFRLVLAEDAYIRSCQR